MRDYDLQTLKPPSRCTQMEPAMGIIWYISMHYKHSSNMHLFLSLLANSTQDKRKQAIKRYYLPKEDIFINKLLTNWIDKHNP